MTAQVEAGINMLEHACSFSNSEVKKDIKQQRYGGHTSYGEIG